MIVCCFLFLLFHITLSIDRHFSPKIVSIANDRTSKCERITKKWEQKHQRKILPVNFCLCSTDKFIATENCYRFAGWQENERSDSYNSFVLKCAAPKTHIFIRCAFFLDNSKLSVDNKNVRFLCCLNDLGLSACVRVDERWKRKLTKMEEATISRKS